MVANETGLANLTLETVWNVYDTLFCEVSPPGCLQDCASPLPGSGLQRVEPDNWALLSAWVSSGQLFVKPGNFPMGKRIREWELLCWLSAVLAALAPSSPCQILSADLALQSGASSPVP